MRTNKMELSQLIRLIQHVVQIAPAHFATTRASRAVKLGILISQERELRRPLAGGGLFGFIFNFTVL